MYVYVSYHFTNVRLCTCTMYVYVHVFKWYLLLPPDHTKRAILANAMLNTVWGRVVAPWTPRYYACLSNRVELIFVCSRGTVVCVYVWTRCEPSDAVWAKRRVGLNKTWLCKLCVVSSVDEVQIVSVVCVCVFVCVFVRWCGLLLVRLRGDHMQNRHQSKEQTVWQILITHAVIVIISFTKLACLVVK